MASVLQRSGYSAEQFARLMDEVAVAEAQEADARGLPGLGKIRGGVRRQTVERWARGISTPKGWSARLALLVIEGLEQTLATGFESGAGSRSLPESWLGRFGIRARASWVAYLLALLTMTGVGFVLVSSVGAGGSDTTLETTAVAPSGLHPLGATPESAPPAANGDPSGPRGSGCDVSPAEPWWTGSDIALDDGTWFGRVMRVDAGPTGSSMIIEITCFYLMPDHAVIIEPGDASMESERAVRMAIDPDAQVHWLDQDGRRVQSGVDEWLAASSDPSVDPPIPCPGGRCSVWISARGGVVDEVVVVEF